MKHFRLLFLALIASTLIIAGCTTKTPEASNNLDTFAQCLTKADVKMFGTATCPHCQNQKKLFGDSFKYIQYVDCFASPTMCSNIATVPTWLFADGSVLN